MKRSHWINVNKNLFTKSIKKSNQSFGDTIFIETGTGYCEGVESALELGFKKIYTCDVKKDRIELAKKKYKHLCNFFAVLDSSSKFIKNILEKESGSFFFWLDAHTPTETFLLSTPRSKILRPKFSNFFVINSFNSNPA